MKGNVVARRYAGALFALGKEKGPQDLEAYGRDLTALAEALRNSPDLMRVFRNPIFSAEEKKEVVARLLAALEISPMVRNFCLLLTDKGRLALLPEIAAVFAALLDVEKGLVRGELVTAVALNQARQDELKATLERQTARKLVLEFSSDASILGGVMLKVGDLVMDASLRSQLNTLKETMKRGG